MHNAQLKYKKHFQFSTFNFQFIKDFQLNKHGLRKITIPFTT